MSLIVEERSVDQTESFPSPIDIFFLSRVTTLDDNPENDEQKNLLDKVCGICMDEGDGREAKLVIQGQGHPTGCKHVFHQDCLQKWCDTCVAGERHANCPACRSHLFSFYEHATTVSNFQIWLSEYMMFVRGMHFVEGELLDFEFKIDELGQILRTYAISGQDQETWRNMVEQQLEWRRGWYDHSGSRSAVSISSISLSRFCWTPYNVQHNRKF
ncbi:hypothetical protein DM02DRAFT_628221 [Periconia macrospinosa]|uniref:RING-type domain-containing protein n=1 Tax=Periconia macrospinosa TaxID=97972 RepID=A0A2V1DU22_9PLEO|nr:hypothetical protein DM02DRAFT_628221 [Periconia macrospinosa]